LADGVTYYSTGLNCCRGHKAARFAANGNCSACLKERGPRRRTAAEKRKRVDDNTYITGRPCARGHMAPRRFSNRTCIECARISRKADSERHKEARNARARERYENDAEYRAKIQAKKTPEWYERAKRRRRERYREDPAYREQMLAPRRGRDQRNQSLKSNYGITLVDYQEMLSAQGGACAICRCQSDRTLHVDHDHKTGAVRGLLCRNCNRGLGCLKDDATTLQNAAEYLKRWL
jgi:hypothetical protein